jgi:hypothetical protein
MKASARDFDSIAVLDFNVKIHGLHIAIDRAYRDPRASVDAELGTGLLFAAASNQAGRRTISGGYQVIGR